MAKNNVIVITDSTCDLSQELIDKNDIKVIYMKLAFDEDVFQDRIEMNSTQLYEEVKKRNVMPKTMAVTPVVFSEEFKKHLQGNNEIIYCGIGSKFSGTFQNALFAKNELDKERIHLVDSQNLSSGSGLLLLKICQLRDKGYAAKDIVERVSKYVPNVRTAFAINNFEYLHKGGRCSGMAKIFGTLLKIKPIIRVEDGGMIVAKKPHGKMKKALDVLLEYVEEDRKNIEDGFVFVTHSKAHDEALYLETQLKERFKMKDVVITDAGSIISCHCGPGTTGILYIVKK
ncbi:MAG: DegV family protein [Erysipelotrichales bacterium]|nr:DegV family protein [Erysipelotrichales bacterium]